MYSALPTSKYYEIVAYQVKKKKFNILFKKGLSNHSNRPNISLIQANEIHWHINHYYGEADEVIKNIKITIPSHFKNKISTFECFKFIFLKTITFI